MKRFIHRKCVYGIDVASKVLSSSSREAFLRALQTAQISSAGDSEFLLELSAWVLQVCLGFGRRDDMVLFLDLGELPMGTIMVVGNIFHLLLGTLRVASFESNLVNPSIPKMEVLDACF